MTFTSQSEKSEPRVEIGMSGKVFVRLEHRDTRERRLPETDNNEKWHVVYLDRR